MLEEPIQELRKAVIEKTAQEMVGVRHYQQISEQFDKNV